MDYQEPFRGHSIFKNQPHSSSFDKPFRSATDALYLHLNEIDPYFLHEGAIEQIQQSDEEVDSRIIDPRLKIELEKHEYDHTDEHCGIEFFESPFKSCLNQKQHAAGIRVLQAWRQCEEVESSDLQTWLKMSRYLQAERLRMKKYVEDYVQKHKTSIYQCTKRLLALYQCWYALEVQRIIKLYPENIAYNTKAGLPAVPLCKPLEDELRARVSDLRYIARAGHLRVQSELQINYKVLSIKLEAYAEKFMLCMQNQKEFFEKSSIRQYLEGLPENTTGAEKTNCLSCYLTLDVLLFLLLAGDSVDLPTEVLLHLEEKVDGEKYIYFEDPLPARNCGWHTYQQVLEQAHAAQLSLDSKIQWLHFDKNKIVTTTEEHLQKDACSVEFKEFKAEKFDDFMQKYLSKKQHLENTQSCFKRNETLVSWKLETYNEEADNQPALNYIQMLTKLELPLAADSRAQTFYGSDNIKLEYKPAMGCEVLTKYELLKLWWQLQLNGTEEGFCTRLSADNFELVLQQHLTRGQVEQYLFEQHHIRLPQILVKLHEFLKLLSNMSTGHYMLRFNPKYTEKLLLYAPTEEINTNTVYLHNLLNVIPSDICFMTTGNVHLPLAENLCSRLHCKYNILPCTFPPATNEDKSKKRVSKKKVFFNDRQHILQRVSQLQRKQMTKINTKKKKRKRAKQAKKRQEKKKEKAAEVEAVEEYEQDMLNDETLFGSALT